MIQIKLKNWFIPVVLLLLTACGGVANEPVVSQESTPTVETATDTPVPSPTEAMATTEMIASSEMMATEPPPTPPETAAPEVSREQVEEAAMPEQEVAEAAEPLESMETVEEATVPAEEPAATEEAMAAEAVEVDWLTVEGKTEAGFSYLGNPDAPITVMDYSDFM